MKISEVIKKLEELKSKEGDVDVVVEYRDLGGSYYGYDYDPLFEVHKDVSLYMPPKDGYTRPYEIGDLDKVIVL